MPDSAGNREAWQRYDLTVNRYGGSGGSGYSNSNDFDESPAADPIQAVYPFETVTLDIPETKNGQDLTESFSDASTPSADSSDFIAGTKCWKSSIDCDGNGYRQFGIREDDQLSDAPGKEGTSNGIATVMFWFKNKMYTTGITPSDTNPENNSHDVYLEIRLKNLGTIGVNNLWRRDAGDISPFPSDQRSFVDWGWGAEFDNHASYPLKDKWYHYTFWVDRSTGDRKISIYDPVAEAILGTDKEFSTTPASLPFADFPGYNSWGMEVIHWALGWYLDPPSEPAAELWLDELAIAKTWLSDADVLKVRQGTYPS